MTKPSHGSRWIVSPVTDCCFFSNIWWVAILLWPIAASDLSQDSPISFWQIYFVTTPHRWITLLLVATDPDRRQNRTSRFVWIAIVATLVVAMCTWWESGLSCLATIDFIWNAWHFGSQHAGILRIYSRKSGGGRPVFESYGIRLFVAYVALRTASQLNGWLEASGQLAAVIGGVDLAVLAIPLLMIITEIVDGVRKKPGKVTYLISVYLVYSLTLLAIREQALRWLIPLSVASAGFHSIEYFAIVSYYAHRRKNTGSEAFFRVLANHWAQFLAIYLVLAGAIASYSDRLDVKIRDWYLMANIWAAYLHYAYDGMIWKLRRSETARSLGAEVPASE